LGSTSHINLLRIESDGIKNWRAAHDRFVKTASRTRYLARDLRQILISRGPRARGAVLKGIILRMERRVSDLLNTVKIGSMDALDERVEPDLRPIKTPACKPQAHKSPPTR